MEFDSLATSVLARFPEVTAREADILARVARGLSNASIASNLGLTERTVKNTLTTIPFKVGLGQDRGGSLRVRLALVVHNLPVAKDE